MSRRQKQLAGWLVSVAFLGCAFSPSAVASGAEATSRKPAAKKTVKKSASHKPTRRYAKRRTNFRYRLARLQPSENRVTEIQEALIREGYLKQEATGKWDDSTRSAMRNYQESNGFAVTGLPDSKSLMKLGLGPHALPEDADPSVAGRASISPPNQADPPAQPAPASQPNSHDKP